MTRLLAQIRPATLASLVVLVIWVAGYSSANSATEIDETILACEDAARFLKDKDIDAALEEARWCLEGVEQLKQQQTLAVFPDEVLEYTGGELSTQEAMGMKMIERVYTLDGNEIKVSLSGGGIAEVGLAALTRLGLNLGASAGKKVRVQRRTVIDMSNGSSTQYTVQLNSGSLLNISSDDLDAEATLDFIKAFPIAELDDALGK